MECPNIVVLGGPNGAGKSTIAKLALLRELGVEEFVNADVIATGLSAFQPESVAIEAGRIMIERLRQLAVSRKSFALETTLSARSLHPWISRLQRKSDYQFHLIYVWLNHPDLNIARVKARVSIGGHDIPPGTVVRRYYRSVKNLFELYLPLADTWMILDNSGDEGPIQVAGGVRGKEPDIFDHTLWLKLQEARDAGKSE